MAYIPEWETLGETQRRVESFGCFQAQLEVCQAISDKNIAVQVMVAKADPDVGGRILEGRSVEVPRFLAPADFDWKRSRPRRLWETGPPQGRGYVGHWFWKPRRIDLIRLRTEDVIGVFGPEHSQNKTTKSEPAGTKLVCGSSKDSATTEERQKATYLTYVAKRENWERTPTLHEDQA